MPSFQSFAVVPCAGHSRRMGRPKLLIEWQGKRLIEHLLDAWLASSVTRVVVVCRADDEILADVCHRRDCDLVVPERDPVDMKASVTHALAWVEKQYAPAVHDAWLLSPADMPHLTSRLIDQLLRSHQQSETPQIILPTFEGRRGHPVLIPWPLAAEVASLAPDRGINSLIARHECRELPQTSDRCLLDIDSPADLASLELISKKTSPQQGE